MRESAVIISSTMPSAKYSCSGSPLMFAKGSTAIDGLSGSGSGVCSATAAGGAAAGASMRMRWARTGRAMFLTCCSPRSSNAKASLSRTWSRTTRLTQMPPGSARVSRRAAMLTPSPKMSSPSMMMSPRLMPTRNSMRVAGGTTAFRCGHLPLHIDRAAHRIDDAGELDQEPVAGGFDNAAAMFDDPGIDQFAPDRFQRRQRAFLVGAHQPRIADHISG